jgi:CubicO group peptidase (beta-lactamase class C family)
VRLIPSVHRLTSPVPRLPLLGDPLRRIRVPASLEEVTSIGPEEVDAAEVGLPAGAVEQIWGGVERLYRSGMHPAIALCLRRQGEVVLDRAIGHARGNGPRDPADGPKRLATPETPFVIYSASKAMTAMVVHLLDQRGLLHIDDRVCEYIPEYGIRGKHVITIAHVLAHKAGVPNLPREAFDLDRIDDREFILEVLCEAKPVVRPGRLTAYHAISGGFLLAEVVRRVTGKGIRELLAEDVLDPLGFRWTNFGVAPEDVERVGRDEVTGPPVPPPLSTLLTRALGVSVDEIVRMAGDPRFLTGVVPSANVVTTANELSRFFELLRADGELDGVRVLDARTLRRATAERSYLEIDLTLGFPFRYSAGFMLGVQWFSLYGPDTDMAFGHLGFTNILCWADPERAISGALITSGKPVLYAELIELWNVMRRIVRETPKVSPPRPMP